MTHGFGVEIKAIGAAAAGGVIGAIAATAVIAVIAATAVTTAIAVTAAIAATAAIAVVGADAKGAKRQRHADKAIAVTELYADAYGKVAQKAYPQG
ncbi:hypothetical protein ET33_20300 [Paenibacillus tyrfis]|uniref:Uncharacterized protein n=1 Tax=Paenibacillus tyrfis TaxID=1501230 RepID=A0A081NWW3_9BACL|nr:hypothetical protein ET33_20300 [Paenibacillus tyrfis]